jgi:hypothetical protein
LVSKPSSHIYIYIYIYKFAITSYNVQNEGASTSRSPLFDGNDYAYWKVKIIIYLQSVDYDLWLSIENRHHKPTKIENDITILKPRSE